MRFTIIITHVMIEKSKVKKKKNKPYPGLEPGVSRLGGGCLNHLASRA